MRRYDPEPYRADGGFSLLGLPIFLGILFLAGVALGALVGFVKQWFYLVVLFPLLAGAAVGGVGLVGLRLGKMRNRWLAGLAGVLAALVCVLAIHYVGYFQFLKEYRKLPWVNVPDAPFALRPGQEKPPPPDFFTWIDLRARQGVRI
jgi:hypothetical protein